MSRVTRRKHVLREMMEDDLELPKEQQQIVRVVSSRGNNLHEVEPAEPDGERFLVSMPTKFRNNVWVKRGGFLLVEPIDEGDKVKAEICKILSAEHIKEYTRAGVWPKRFSKKREHAEDDDDDVSTEEDDDGAGFMVRNRNRPKQQEPAESDEDNTDDEDSSSEEN